MMETRQAPRIHSFGGAGLELADCLFSWIEGRNREESNVHLMWDEDRALFTLSREPGSMDLTDEEFQDLLAFNIVGRWYAHPSPTQAGENRQICLRHIPLHRPGSRMEGYIFARVLQQPVFSPMRLGQSSHVTKNINFSALSGQNLSIIGPYIQNIGTGQLLNVMGNLVQGPIGHFRLKYVFGFGTLFLGVEYDRGTSVAWVVRRIRDWREVSRVSFRDESDVSCFPLTPGFLWVACYHPSSGRSIMEIRRGNAIIQDLDIVNYFAYPLSNGRFASFNSEISEILVWGQSNWTNNLVLERRIIIPDASRVETYCGYLHLKDRQGASHGKIDRLGRFVRATPGSNENEHIVFERFSQAFLAKEGDQWCLHFRQLNNVLISSHSLNTNQKPNLHLFSGSFLCLFHSNQIFIWSDSGLLLHKFPIAVAGAESCQFADNRQDTITVLLYNARSELLAAMALRFDDVPPEDISTVPSAANLSIHHGDVIEDACLTMQSILREIARKPDTPLQQYDVDAILTMVQPLPASERSNIFQMCCAISEQVPGVPLLVVDMIQYGKGWSTIHPYYKRLAEMIDNRQELAKMLRRIICALPSNYEQLVTNAALELIDAICPKLAPADRSWLKDIIAARPLEIRPTLVHDCASLLEALPPVFVQYVNLRESLRTVVDLEMDATARQNLLQYAQTWVQIYSEQLMKELSAAQKELIVSRIASLPEQEQSATLEICTPIFEEFSGEQRWTFLLEILDLPMDQRRAARNRMMEQRHLEVENVMGYSYIRILHAKREMLRILGISHTGPTSKVCAEELQKIQSHLLSYLPSIAPDDAKDLFERCLRRQRPALSDDSPEIVRKSWIELETKLDAKLTPSRRAFFCRIRADAPELANAWCTLNGSYVSNRDHSRPLMSSTDTATVGIAVMTWMLIEKHPNEQERQNMKYEYGWALAQDIDEEHNHRVCGHGHQVRFITILQGPDRYPTIIVDHTTLQQRFAAHLMELDKSLEGRDPVVDDFQRFLDNLLDDHMPRSEINWVLEELKRYCIITEWEFDASSLSVLGGSFTLENSFD
ncbi:hypothetical protein B7494_g928 [Chlorociboria aeruginascens]|nr:hypothetical protein B7494_g928 [Chlorociboria aeruginascens]